MSRVELNNEDWRCPFRTLLPSDRQSENSVLVIESFHPELVDVVKAKCSSCMVPRDKKTASIYFIREFPEMQTHL